MFPKHIGGQQNLYWRGEGGKWVLINALMTMTRKEGGEDIRKGRNRRRGVAVTLLCTALPPPAPALTHTGLTMGEKLFLFSENSLENPSHTHLLKHKILTLGCACTRANAHRVTQRHMCQRRDSAAWLTLHWLQNDIVGRSWPRRGPQ